MPKTHEKAASKEASPKKKSIFKDIFGSEEEPDFVPERKKKIPLLSLMLRLISTIEENLAEEREEERKRLS